MKLLLAIFMAASIIPALRKAEGHLRFYLWAQLASFGPLWIGAWRWDIWSPWYAATYVAATLPILWGVARICWEALDSREYRLRSLAIGFVFAGVLGRLAYFGLQHPVTAFDWINILLGVFLALAGTILGFAAPYLKRWDIGLTLAIFWMSQAVSSFGWTIHLWERLNWIIDPCLGIAAFLILRLLLGLRRPYSTPQVSSSRI